MADKKVTELTALTAPASGDVLLIVDDVGGTPVSKKITLKSLFGSVPANTVFTSRVSAQANVAIAGANTSITANVNITGITAVSTLKINDKRTPANSTALTIKQGTFFYDANNLYIATANNVVKRVALSAF